jgi:hypothetical protein
MAHKTEDHRTFKGSGITKQIEHWSLAHQVTEEVVSLQPFANRAKRRHFQMPGALHALGKKVIIPKEERQQGMNYPHRNPERAQRKAEQRAERKARRGNN